MRSEVQVAQYIVKADEAEIQRNAAALALHRVYDKLGSARHGYGATYVGAKLASLLLKYAFLAELTLEVIADFEHDDEGGYYRTVEVHVMGFECVPGVPIPSEFLDAEGVDTNAVEYEIECEFECDSHDFYTGFVSDSASTEHVTFTVRRKSIDDLLTQQEVSGLQVFVRLFPERVKLSGIPDLEGAHLNGVVSANDPGASVLNPAQKTCLKFYAGGDFAHLLNIESQDAFQIALQGCGDGLLRFLVMELATSEDCHDIDSAIGRVARAVEDIEAVQLNLGQLPGDTQWEFPV